MASSATTSALRPVEEAPGGAHRKVNYHGHVGQIEKRFVCLRKILGRAGPPHRLDQTLHKREKYLLRAGLRLDQMVRGRNHQCRAKLHRPASCPARQPGRDHLGRRRPEGVETYHLPGTARRGLPSRQCPKSHGVKKGDTVTIYLPMIPEAAYAMLACARIGAVHSVVFGGFSPDSLAGRIEDCRSKGLITADEGPRRPQGAAEGQCRRGAPESPESSRRCSSSSAPAAPSIGSMAATSGTGRMAKASAEVLPRR